MNKDLYHFLSGEENEAQRAVTCKSHENQNLPGMLTTAATLPLTHHLQVDQPITMIILCQKSEHIESVAIIF